jgi:hypothetical protein
MDRAEAFTKFPTAKEVRVFLDTISFSGCGFGVTAEGDRVFLNARLVSAVGLREGDTVTCQILPNYEDRRDDVPFRAIRADNPRRVVVTVDQDYDDPPEVVEQDVAAEPTIKDRILQHLRDTGPTCTGTLVKVMGDPSLGTTEMHALCSAMHKVGTIARADVYRRAGQDRASMVVWALSANEFEVDQ